ncbi:hypothetical protein [Kitasatospora sp. NPDC001527]|uniref:hypothetical protein n=1 Tax=Kitasatospora sp. NPDC001527 TaxID=3154519 RepID=UPI0033340074
MYPRYAPIAKTIRTAEVREFRAGDQPGHFTEESVPLTLVPMTTAELEGWEWVTDVLPPTGQAPQGTKVYFQQSGELLGILLTVGSGWHAELWDTVLVGDYTAVHFPGPRGTARTEGMALQQVFQARDSALRQAQILAEKHRQEIARKEAEEAARWEGLYARAA